MVDLRVESLVDFIGSLQNNCRDLRNHRMRDREFQLVMEPTIGIINAYRLKWDHWAAVEGGPDRFVRHWAAVEGGPGRLVHHWAGLGRPGPSCLPLGGLRAARAVLSATGRAEGGASRLVCRWGRAEGGPGRLVHYWTAAEGGPSRVVCHRAG